MALSRWPLPCFAAVKSAEPFPFGEAEFVDMCCCESSCGSERSVEDELNVCENQPERREGRSVTDKREPVLEVDAYRLFACA